MTAMGKAETAAEDLVGERVSGLTRLRANRWEWLPQDVLAGVSVAAVKAL